MGTGISAKELACNDQLSSFVAADLNTVAVLPYPDKSFDAVTCAVGRAHHLCPPPPCPCRQPTPRPCTPQLSFNYLTKPKEVMREVARVLRPGGRLILAQSNRCFYTKAVGVWTADMSDDAHLRVLGTYIHFEPGLSEPRAFDISPQGRGANDPLYIVEATRM